MRWVHHLVVFLVHALLSTVKAHVFTATNEIWMLCHVFSSVSEDIRRTAKHTRLVVTLFEKNQDDSYVCC
jgi:hypothetical protein